MYGNIESTIPEFKEYNIQICKRYIRLRIMLFFLRNFQTEIVLKSHIYFKSMFLIEMYLTGIIQ